MRRGEPQGAYRGPLQQRAQPNTASPGSKAGPGQARAQGWTQLRDLEFLDFMDFIGISWVSLWISLDFIGISLIFL